MIQKKSNIVVTSSVQSIICYHDTAFDCCQVSRLERILLVSRLTQILTSFMAHILFARKVLAFYTVAKKSITEDMFGKLQPLDDDIAEACKAYWKAV